MQAWAVLLYALGKASFGTLARLLHVSDGAVLKWVRAEAAKLPAPEGTGDTVVCSLDAMGHFLKKRQQNYGCGGPRILSSGDPWPGCWVAVMMQPAKSSLIKSVSKAKSCLATRGKAPTALSLQTHSSPAQTCPAPSRRTTATCATASPASVAVPQSSPRPLAWWTYPSASLTTSTTILKTSLPL